MIAREPQKGAEPLLLAEKMAPIESRRQIAGPVGAEPLARQ
jgi:hypothetical protein